MARSVDVTPPLVLLHAFPLDARLFDPIRSAVETRVRLLTPDLRGFGAGLTLSEPLPSDPLPTPDLGLLADDVVAELDAAGIDRAIVGGVSMGGYVALTVLRRYPDRVAGLVLANTRCGADDSAALERRLAAARRADNADIATGIDAIAPLIADTTPGNVRAELARIAGAVPAATIGWAQRALPVAFEITGPASDG